MGRFFAARGLDFPRLGEAGLDGTFSERGGGIAYIELGLSKGPVPSSILARKIAEPRDVTWGSKVDDQFMRMRVQSIRPA